jgi:hypothetical protein
MAQHIRNQQQHVRQQPQHVNTGVVDYIKDTYRKMTGKAQHIRSSPKMMMGTIFMILLIIVLILVALHYFRIITLPLPVPQKPAPSSHLQYFFF